MKDRTKRFRGGSSRRGTASPGRSSARRHRGRVAAAGTSAVVLGALAIEHRLAAAAVASEADMEAAGLVLPDDLVHHDVHTDDGGMIHVVERGEGPAIILLHGVTLTHETWVHQLRHLADSYRVLALDQRGHGRSVPGSDFFDAPARWPSGPGARAMKRMAADVVSVMDALEVDRALLVGHSMGGMVTLQLLHDAPDEVGKRIAGMALVATTAGPFLGVPGFARALEATTPLTRHSLEALDRRSMRLLPTRDLAYWSTRLAFGADAPAVQVRFAEKMINSMSPGVMARLLGDVAGFDLSSGLASIEQPASVVVGTHDRLTPPWHARRLVRTLPDAQLFEQMRCGHMVMLERPGELNRILGETAAKVLT